MNRLPSSRHAPRSCPWAVAFLLLAALPGSTLAQKPVAPPPAVTPSPAFGPSLALSQKEALSQKQMLDADKRLDRLVSLDVISVPLDEVLQKQSVNTKPGANTKPDTDKKDGTDAKPDPDRLVLTASHNCEALKLQIRLNRRPLRTLMTALAEMLPGTWTRTKDGYNLSLTDKAVIARAEWWRLFLGERDKALALQRQAVLAAMQNKARRRQAGDPEPDEPSDHAVEEDKADQHDFFHALPQALKEQITANMDDSPFYEVGRLMFSNYGERFGTVGWLSQMSPETQERFKATMQDNVNRLAQAPPALQGYARQAQSGLATLDPNRVYFLFLNGGFLVMAMPFNSPSAGGILDLHVPMTVNTLPLLLNQTRLADVVYGGADIPPQWKHAAEVLRKRGEAVSPDMKMLVYQVYGLGDAAPLEWKQLAAYQRGRVWPNTLPKLMPEDKEGAPGTNEKTVNALTAFSRAAQTDWLGERGGLEYVSDYYSHGGYAMPEDQRKRPVKRPMATELDEMAAKRDVSWRQDTTGIVLIRNNRWYRDDDLEVPEPLLRRWFTHLLQARQQEAAAEAAIPPVLQSPEERTAALKDVWDWTAEVFSTLTPWQLRNGLALFQPEEKDLAPQNAAVAAKLFKPPTEPLKREKPQGTARPSSDFVGEMCRRPPFSLAVSTLKGYPHTTHLYSSLDDAGRAALLEGRLSASTLSPAQLAEAASLLPMLPQALQSFPADSVLLNLSSSPFRIAFGAPLPTSGLKVVTPQSAPQNAP